MWERGDVECGDVGDGGDVERWRRCGRYGEVEMWGDRGDVER